MDQIITAIMDRISERVPEVSLIDEDYGQLEMLAADDDRSDSYPVTFPCVLISESETAWSDVKSSLQRGDTSLSVRLAVDCYTDTRHSAPDREAGVRSRQSLVRDLFDAIQGMRPVTGASALTRTRSSSTIMPGFIKVYEFTFRLRCSQSF